jgi:hypothetical protein
MVGSFVYAGSIAALNLDSGTTTKRIFDDGPGLDRNPSTEALSSMGGKWLGAGRMFGGAGRVIVYGSGATNLAYCLDEPNPDGDATCTAITGLPNQNERVYYDLARTPSNSVLLLARAACNGICPSTSYYLVALPAGADPTDGKSWVEHALTSENLGRGPRPTAIAASATQILVYGTVDDHTSPYVLHWNSN